LIKAHELDAPTDMAMEN